MQERRDQVNARKVFECRDSDLLCNAHPAHGRLRSVNWQAACEPRRARLSGRGLSASPTRNAETVKNHPRGIGSIECVKVNASHVVIQKIVTLFQGEVNADASDPFRIVFASLKSAH